MAIKTTKTGAYCPPTGAIVPMYDSTCEWCGSTAHPLRYVWNDETLRWDEITKGGSQ